uniref:Uncharacterized protein n=1 Tax=Xenopus tropicalis TaxID=8364 RepID=A0A1B8XV36_XENTR
MIGILLTIRFSLTFLLQLCPGLIKEVQADNTKYNTSPEDFSSLKYEKTAR